ncbi:Alg9-like mannosyltransferase family-domain-containing protein [Irpex rosettiformis]|uniref:Alg9-like mannosyltransferase family-domain-containing protein n=1 Tax=Irpex rosettiformis TaxID=378272 RepID=A0ACB8UJD5_9APHY|nr:Alg9-like mannosyltransferase family-domain-containing protein [Irpex rosettiformis]
MSVALDLLLLTTSWAHVLLAPYNKVEESFNLHATHDVLAYGIGSESLSKYDHLVFPGAVPRTFVGSVVLGFLSRPAAFFASHLGAISTKADLQVVIRLVLAVYNVIGFSLLRRAVSRRYGGAAGVLFVLITCTQFHLPFWMSRTLPNMFALLPVNVAVYLLWNRYPNAMRPLQRDIHLAIALLTFTAVVFRAEILLLLGPVVLQALWQGYTKFWRVVKVGLISGAVSIALTVTVDSFFWQQWPLWPELYGIYFNVVQGKSAEWGVSPFHSYFTAHLPNLLTTSTFLSAVGALIDGRIRSLLLPVLAYVLLLSGLGHKEWRFVVYVVPIFNIAAARGASWLISRRKGSVFGRLAFLAVAGFLALNCVITFIYSVSSINNYPGGVTLARFNEMYADRRDVHVHISNLAAQTGASLFLQTHTPPYFPDLGVHPQHPTSDWVYNKTENITPEEITANRHITHVIAEVHNRHASVTGNVFKATRFPKGSWVMTAVIPAFERWRFHAGSLKLEPMKPWKVLEYVEIEKLVILERKEW